MFSFRYHAISLIAVFLALGIGVLLGVSIGEEGIVSDARKDLENSLRGDLRDARSRNSDLRAELRLRDDFENQSYQGLVDDLLPGFRVGVIAMGDLPSDYTEVVRDAVEPAGADLSSISVIRAPLRLEDVAARLDKTSLERLDRDRDTLARFGERLGRVFVQGGGLVERVKDELLSSSRGKYRGLDAVVLVRDRDELKGDEEAAQDRFEAALIEGLRSTDATVVGVEPRDADPSQIPFMREHGLTSVDDLDLIAGQAALVYALLGADGQFGVKDTASQLLPPPPIEGERRR
jgi:Copper transport outer membrane protein, MctB